MKVAWCWMCRTPHPMLDDAEFDAVFRDYTIERDKLIAARKVSTLPQESNVIRMRAIAMAEQTPSHEKVPIAVLIYKPLQAAYEALTGLKFYGKDPAEIMHYRRSAFGPPCPFCGILLRTEKAKQCLECSMDWHDSEHVVCHKTR